MEVITSETIIKFADTNVVEVQLTYTNGTRQTKNINFDELMNMIKSSIEPDTTIDIVDTPILPNNEKFGISTIRHRTYSNGTEMVVILKKAHRCDIKYHSSDFENVGIPNLIFAIRLRSGQITNVHCMCCKSVNIKANTKLYSYPFSNVDDKSGSICFGSNGIMSFDFKEIARLHGFPSMFLSMPNNDHMYGHNLSGLGYRPLLESLVNKDFDNKILKSAGCTFGEWYDGLR